MPTATRPATRRSKEAPPKAEDQSEEGVLDLFAKLEFFRPELESSNKILQLGQQLSHNYVEAEISNLERTERKPLESSVLVVDKSWMRDVVQKVSSILFHEESTDTEENTFSEGEVFTFFQKTLSQKIYNHLNMLVYTPHAISRKPFSIKEELTDGIAENIGMGLYLEPETHPDLRSESEKALTQLAWEFQRWLLKRGGSYTATWGEIDTIGNAPMIAGEGLVAKIFREPAIEGAASGIMLIPDVERRREPRSGAQLTASAGKAGHAIATTDSAAKPSIAIESLSASD